jgi:hypothetical protein
MPSGPSWYRFLGIGPDAPPPDGADDPVLKGRLVAATDGP